MKYDFSVRQIPNQLTAVSMHNRLRAAKAPVVVMGRFYSAMIERGLWISQKDLAAGLGVSTAHTSRMLAVARLPEVLLEAIADKPVSAAEVATLHALIRQVGEKLVAERAANLPSGSTTAEIFAFLTTGQRLARNAVRISIARGKNRGKKYLRIDAADFASVASRVREIEALVNALLAADGVAPPPATPLEKG